MRISRGLQGAYISFFVQFGAPRCYVALSDCLPDKCTPGTGRNRTFLYIKIACFGRSKLHVLAGQPCMKSKLHVWVAHNCMLWMVNIVCCGRSKLALFSGQHAYHNQRIINWPLADDYVGLYSTSCLMLLHKYQLWCKCINLYWILSISNRSDMHWVGLGPWTKTITSPKGLPVYW